MDQVKPLGIGVIGTGFWGKNHVRIYKEMDGVELKAISDINEANAKTLGEKYEVDWYTNNRELLKRSDIDAISICTPTIFHAEHALQAIEHSKHLLIEKPISKTPEESKEIINAARRKGIHIMVGFIERFNPAVQKVKTMVHDGVIGEVVLIEAKRVGRWPERIGDIGVVKDTAIHDLDILRFILEESPNTVYARIGSFRHKLEDNAEILLGFKSKRTGFVEANWLTPHKIRNLIVTGSEKIVTVDYITQEITVEGIDEATRTQTKWIEPLTQELKHFVESIKMDQEPSVTALDGLKALEIADAALKSGEIGQVIHLE
jgi:UDP-N-acetylglucosamine 3-dehydrogenase